MVSRPLRARYGQPADCIFCMGETPQSDFGVCDMARFTNYATLSYNGGTTDSNTVTGELLATLSMTKTAVMDDYTQKDDVTYVISLVNGGTTAVTGLTVTDDLGGYTLGENTVYPLAYTDGSLRYYVNGVLQTAPAVTAGPPLVVTGVSIPAGGNALLIYETSVTNYAPLGPEATITNTATVTGNGFDQTAQETIAMEPRADLSISKALCPVTVTENGQLTYTFVIENAGSVAAAAADNVVLTDTFDPKLNSIAVTFNGTPWSEGVNYTYDTTTGLFQTLPGQAVTLAITTVIASGTDHRSCRHVHAESGRHLVGDAGRRRADGYGYGLRQRRGLNRREKRKRGRPGNPGLPSCLQRSWFLPHRFCREEVLRDRKYP